MSLYTRISINPSLGAVQTSPKMYRGFSTVNQNTENFALYDFDLIKQDLLNQFYIRQGERLMNPRFGTIIWDLIFEPLTTEIKEAILKNVNDIINYDPRIQASNVVVSQYDTGIEVQCTLTYVQYNLSESLKLQFDQANSIVS